MPSKRQTVHNVPTLIRFDSLLAADTFLIPAISQASMAFKCKRRTACAWEMGLPAVRNTDPGAGAGPGNRQGHPDRRPAGACAGGEIRRPLAAASVETGIVANGVSIQDCIN